jgi:hypothetical protein
MSLSGSLPDKLVVSRHHVALAQTMGQRDKRMQAHPKVRRRTANRETTGGDLAGRCARHNSLAAYLVDLARKVRRLPFDIKHTFDLEHGRFVRLKQVAEMRLVEQLD